MKNPKIALIDYGAGNTFSVKNALEHLGYKRIFLTSDSDLIEKSDVLILPGVGAFDRCVKELEARDLISCLSDQVLNYRKPILGICVGMQLFASYSYENGCHAGLNWIPGNVKRIQGKNLKVPHVGWNEISSDNRNSDEKQITPFGSFFFDHSYEYVCDENFVESYTIYGRKIVASIISENIFGVQFHPEKSQNNGLKVFRNFFESM